MYSAGTRPFPLPAERRNFIGRERGASLFAYALGGIQESSETVVMVRFHFAVLFVLLAVAASVSGEAIGGEHSYTGGSAGEILVAPFADYYMEPTSHGLYGGYGGAALHGEWLAVPSATPSDALEARIIIYRFDNETREFGPYPTDYVYYETLTAGHQLGVSAVALSDKFLAAGGENSLRIYVRRQAWEADYQPLFAQCAEFSLNGGALDIKFAGPRLVVSVSGNLTETFVRTGAASWNRSDFLAPSYALASRTSYDEAGSPGESSVFLLAEEAEILGEMSGQVLEYTFSGARSVPQESRVIDVPSGAISLAASARRGLLAVGNRVLSSAGLYEMRNSGDEMSYELAQTIFGEAGFAWSLAFTGHSESIVVGNPVMKLSEDQVTALKDAGYTAEEASILYACGLQQFMDLGNGEDGAVHFELVASEAVANPNFNWPTGIYISTDASRGAIGDFAVTPVPYDVPAVTVFDGTP